MALDIKNPNDQRFLKGLIFGPAGQGKTHFLGTAQEDERTAPMLLLDFEGGHETLAGLDIDVAEIRDWDDYSEAYELLSNGEHEYKSVGIDSVSETHLWALLEILREKGPSRRDPDAHEIQDYQKAGTQLRRMLRHFRDLPMHVFYTALAKEVEERGIGRVKVPAMSGQMAEEVPGLMSVVGYLAIQEAEEEGEDDQRVLLLENYPGFRTKARTPWGAEAPDELVNPNVTDLLDALDITGPRKRKKNTTKKKED